MQSRVRQARPGTHVPKLLFCRDILISPLELSEKKSCDLTTTHIVYRHDKLNVCFNLGLLVEERASGCCLH